VEKLSDEEVQKKFGALDRDFKEAIDKSYLDVEFKLGDEVLKFEEIQLHRMVLEYGQAVMFLQKMYKDYLDDTPWDRDFEVDLSNSTKPMTPQEHYFLANELKRAAVKFDTLCVDAVTMREEMAANGTLHAAIAKAFDYRVSFTNCTLVFDDLEDAAKALHHKVNFKLTKLLWIAALQTVAENGPGPAGPPGGTHRTACPRQGRPGAREPRLHGIRHELRPAPGRPRRKGQGPAARRCLRPGPRRHVRKQIDGPGQQIHPYLIRVSVREKKAMSWMRRLHS
jgi:SpoU rRNA methylase family enzyme